MSTIQELSLLLNNFGSTVLNFLGDSLTSINYHKEKNINNLLGVSARRSVEDEFEHRAPPFALCSLRRLNFQQFSESGGHLPLVWGKKHGISKRLENELKSNLTHALHFGHMSTFAFRWTFYNLHLHFSVQYGVTIHPPSPCKWAEKKYRVIPPEGLMQLL